MKQRPKTLSAFLLVAFFLWQISKFKISILKTAFSCAIIRIGRNAHQNNHLKGRYAMKKHEIETLIIDCSLLMDLRVDFAFKCFIEGNPEALISLLNAIFCQRKIVNKDIIENARKEKEVIRMAVSAIARQSEDKIMWQAYQRRKDEIYFHNKELADRDLTIAEKDTTIADQAKIIAELRSRLGEN